MMAILVSTLAFLSVFLAVFAANALLIDLREADVRRQRDQEEERRREQQIQRARNQTQSPYLGDLAQEAQAESRVREPWHRRCSIWIDQAGLRWTPSSYLAYVLLGAVLGCALGGTLGLVAANFNVILSLAAVGAVLGSLSPWAYVHVKRWQRFQKMRAQLPDAFDLMARVMRAGQTVSQAMQAVAEEFPDPLGLEFLYCSEQINMGLNPEKALRELGQRTGLLEMRIYALSVVVHRQTGGNLAQLLDKLATVVRERFRIQGMIQSLTAQGRFQAAILLSLPPFMFVLLMFLQPEYESILLQHPLLIVAALGMMALGASWIRKIVNFDY